MLIKVYLQSDKTMRIIENVSDVRVHFPRYSYDDAEETKHGHFGPTECNVPRMPLFFPNEESIQHRLMPTGGFRCKFIDCTLSDGLTARIMVEDFAYICNDEGKTIEKVDAGRD